MVATSGKLKGLWRIVEMDLWDNDAIDLVGPAFIEFFAEQTGRFRFIVVEGYLDCAATEPGQTRVEFTWEGTDEGDRVSGRGWVQPDADVLRGHIYFHNGDDSGFVATKQTKLLPK